MKCPACNHDTDVIDSRPTDYGKEVRRRRVCKSCKHRFTTYEKVFNVNQIPAKKAVDELRNLVTKAMKHYSKKLNQ